MSQNSAILLTWQADHLDEQAMSALAQATADLATRCLRAQSSPAGGFRVYLHGGLGAGKTTWVRHFLQACGVTGRIKSPSFSIVESYEINGLTAHHFDFYRQTNPEQWQGGGLRDLLLEPAITLVEWPEHAAGLPSPHLELWLDWADKDDAEGPRRVKLCFYDLPDQALPEEFLKDWGAQTHHLLTPST